jgi:hypothetical protein
MQLITLFDQATIVTQLLLDSQQDKTDFEVMESDG